MAVFWQAAVLLHKLKGGTIMRQMLAGIFIVLLSIWLFILDYANNAAVFLYLGTASLVVAMLLFIIGYMNNKDKG